MVIKIKKSSTSDCGKKRSSVTLSNLFCINSKITEVQSADKNKFLFLQQLYFTIEQCIEVWQKMFLLIFIWTCIVLITSYVSVRIYMQFIAILWVRIFLFLTFQEIAYLPRGMEMQDDPFLPSEHLLRQHIWSGGHSRGHCKHCWVFADISREGHCGTNSMKWL